MTEFEPPDTERGYAQAIYEMLEKGEDDLRKFVSDLKSEEYVGQDYAKTRNDKEIQNATPESFSNVELAVKVTAITAKELRWAYSKYMSEIIQEQKHKGTEE